DVLDIRPHPTGEVRGMAGGTPGEEDLVPRICGVGHRRLRLGGRLLRPAGDERGQGIDLLDGERPAHVGAPRRHVRVDVAGDDDAAVADDLVDVVRVDLELLGDAGAVQVGSQVLGPRYRTALPVVAVAPRALGRRGVR